MKINLILYYLELTSLRLPEFLLKVPGDRCAGKYIQQLSLLYCEAFYFLLVTIGKINIKGRTNKNILLS